MQVSFEDILTDPFTYIGKTFKIQYNTGMTVFMLSTLIAVSENGLKFRDGTVLKEELRSLEQTDER